MQEATQSGGWAERVGLGEGAQVDRAVLEERTEQGGAHQGDIEGALGMASAFSVLAPGDIAAIVIAGFDTPVAAAQPQQVLGCVLLGP